VQRFLATRSARTVGRIAAILDPRYNEFHNENTGFFGFLEMIEDAAVASRLLETAREWLRQRGVDVIRGPVNPSTNYECGLLVDGFDSSPRVMMTSTIRITRVWWNRRAFGRQRICWHTICACKT